MLTVASPDVLHGAVLVDDLASVGIAAPVVYLEVGSLYFPRLGEADRDAVAAALVGHSDRARARQAADLVPVQNETTIRDRATTALADNKTFLAVASPTNAQVVAQVKALTRQNNALIRLALHKFDGTD